MSEEKHVQHCIIYKKQNFSGKSLTELSRGRFYVVDKVCEDKVTEFIKLGDVVFTVPTRHGYTLFNASTGFLVSEHEANDVRKYVTFTQTHDIECITLKAVQG